MKNEWNHKGYTHSTELIISLDIIFYSHSTELIISLDISFRQAYPLTPKVVYYKCVKFYQYPLICLERVALTSNMDWQMNGWSDKVGIIKAVCKGLSESCYGSSPFWYNKNERNLSLDNN